MSLIHTTKSEYREVDLETWPRREHYDFFCSYRDPFFSITVEVVCEGVLQRCDRDGISKTFALWHGVLQAANAVSEFRYRIGEFGPVIYDEVHLSPVVLRPDGTFTIAFLPFVNDLHAFSDLARQVVEEGKESKGFSLDVETRRIDLIHFSTVPWFRFTGLSHARVGNPLESEPKVTIGRYGKGADGRITIPVSVTAHHGLMDGLHVGHYFEELERIWA